MTNKQHQCGSCGYKNMIWFCNCNFENVKNLSGWECFECGEIDFDLDSAIKYSKANDELVMAERLNNE